MVQKSFRNAAKELGAKYYFTGNPCKRQHIEMRLTATGICLECRKYTERISSKIRYQKDPNKVLAKNKRLRQNRLEKDLEAKRQYYLQHKEKALLYQKWYKENNRAKVRAWQKAYKESKQNRTPPWLTKEHKEQILRFYQEAERLTKETDIEHHVDHIIPLRGKTVSGLHVPWNLQILTYKENRQKSNKF